MGFISFKLLMKRIEMDFILVRFFLCCKYISFDVGSCIVYEKNIFIIMVILFVFIIFIVLGCL